VAEHDPSGPCPALGQRHQQVVARDSVGHVPAPVTLVGPRVVDGLSFESPVEPTTFDVNEVVDQLER